MNELYTQTLNANEQIHSPDAWSNFSTGPWQSTVDVRDFISATTPLIKATPHF